MSIRDYEGFRTGKTSQLPGDYGPLTDEEIKHRGQYEPLGVHIGPVVSKHREGTEDATGGSTGPGTGNRKASLRARGRVRKRKGEMNKEEVAFAEMLQHEQHAGEVVWWAFEAVTLRLADKTTWTPDFAVLYQDGSLWLIDVKGAKKTKAGNYVPFVEVQTKVKIKVAAEQFPITIATAHRLPKKAGGEWVIEEV